MTENFRDADNGLNLDLKYTYLNIHILTHTLTLIYA